MSNRTVTVWCNRRQASIPKHQYQAERYAEIAHARSDLPCPMVISDQLYDMKSMVDGQIYTSKRAYEKSVRRQGCEIVGNDDPAKHIKTPEACSGKAYEAELASDVKTAIAQVEAKL